MDIDFSLPKIIFVSHSDTATANHFANELADLRHDILPMSLRAPLEAAVVGLFFDNDPGAKVGTHLPKPFESMEVEDFKAMLHLGLERWLDENYLEKLILNRIFENSDLYDTFVILVPDSKTNDPDTCPISKEFEGQICFYIPAGSLNEARDFIENFRPAPKPDPEL